MPIDYPGKERLLQFNLCLSPSNEVLTDEQGMKTKKSKHERALTLDKNFTPVSIDEGDEFYRNGIFEFNITKMLSFINSHQVDFKPELVAVKDFVKEFSSINEGYTDSVCNTTPVILAEIPPGRYNLIDGNHRMEKARRSGTEYVTAYRIRMEQHIQFLTTQKGYIAYVEYWNGKLKD